MKLDSGLETGTGSSLSEAAAHDARQRRNETINANANVSTITDGQNNERDVSERVSINGLRLVTPRTAAISERNLNYSM